MTVATALTDPCCFHATLGTMLLDRFPEQDPALVLGDSATTEAADSPDGPVFDHIATALSDSLHIRGHLVAETDLRTEAGAAALHELLRRGTPLIAVADTYALDHYWMDRGRNHALHAVLLRDYDPADGSVRLTDPMDATLHDGRTPLAALDAALFAGPLSQSVLHVTAWAPTLTAEGEDHAARMPLHADSLAGPIGPELSGTALAASLARRLDQVLMRMPLLARVDQEGVGQAERQQAVSLMLGLWGYHHRLRWFARYLRCVPVPEKARLDGAADLVERAAHDWLAVRTLLTRAGMSGPEQQGGYREEITLRLTRIGELLEKAAARLRPSGQAGGCSR
ncbi:cysteine peptidase family C39 domain-containing protein [Streptacidiphilus rugosus]|uniref:hypothetical protein n=1 Tax=Streptacidiphilus rugosus TaxID=405783 RepID=UPI00055C37B7|nr:hypothetical protein [Streptacidiphilus rugosus]